MELRHRFGYAEARGEIPKGTADFLTLATILESGVIGVLEGYYGTARVHEARSRLGKGGSVEADREQQMLRAAEAAIRHTPTNPRSWQDLQAAVRRPLRTGFGALITTTEFPELTDGLMKIPREEIPPAMAGWRGWVPPRAIGTVSSFRPIRGIRQLAMPSLPARPEGGSVEYVSIQLDEDDFTVANHELAIEFTWEMWLNDEHSAFRRAAILLGESGTYTESVVVHDALRAGITRTTATGLMGSATAPTADKLELAIDTFNVRKVKLAGGGTRAGAVMATDVLVSGKYQTAVFKAVEQEFLNPTAANVVDNRIPNPAQGLMPHVDRTMSGAASEADDWFVFDRNVDWLDVRQLEGYTNGPRISTRMPDVREGMDEGSFDNHALAIKAGIVIGAKVTATEGAMQVQG